MAVLTRRARMVYFRISEDEFRQIMSVCEREGARSISDLARRAVQRLIADSNRHREEQDVASKVQMLEKLVAELTAQLQFLRSLLNNRDTAVGDVACGSLGERGPTPVSQQLK